MINGQRVLAVIPARAGSRGLPGKNIRPFSGKPLVAWSIEQALACVFVDDVMVSTDCSDIAQIAVGYGARVPFLRPAALAEDTASSVDVLIHVVDTLEARGESYGYLVLLEPTSPLRDVSDIAGALLALANNPLADSVVGVAKAEASHPAFLMRLNDEWLQPLSGTIPTGIRRQDLQDEYYYLEGSVYVSTVAALRRSRSFYHGATLPWVVERYKAIEIDELCDFIAAEALMRARIGGLLE